jgi:uncharacterized protein YdaU (DUF1376 family)
MPFFVDDYAHDTQGLHALEHAGYLLLIHAYWKNRGPLENNDAKLARIACMKDREWLKVRDCVLGFFQCDDRFLRHKRIDEELEIAKRKIESAVAAGKKSGIARKRDH